MVLRARRAVSSRAWPRPSSLALVGSADRGRGLEARRSSPPSTRSRTRRSGSAATASPSPTSRPRAPSRTTSSSTPKQIDELLDADLVLDLGRDFQPAVEKAPSSATARRCARLLPRAAPKRSARLARPGADGEHRAHRRNARSRKADPKGAGRVPAQRRRVPRPARRARHAVRGRPRRLRAEASSSPRTRRSATWPRATACARRAWPDSRPTPSPTPSGSPTSPIS